MLPSVPWPVRQPCQSPTITGDGYDQFIVSCVFADLWASHADPEVQDDGGSVGAGSRYDVWPGGISIHYRSEPRDGTVTWRERWNSLVSMNRHIL